MTLESQKIGESFSVTKIRLLIVKFSGRGPQEQLYPELTEYLNPQIRVPVRNNQKYRKNKLIEVILTGTKPYPIDS